MLNYLSGELFKLRRHKFLYVGATLLLALEGAFFLLLSQEDAAFQKNFLEPFFDAALFVGLFIAPIFAILAFDDQHRNGTLKNEIVYGIPRSRIYFGKLMAGGAMGTLVSILAAGVYLAVAVLLTHPYGNGGTLLIHTVSSFVGHWMTWLSIYSLTFFLLMLFRGTATAVSLVYVITMFGFPFSMVDLSQSHIPGWLRLGLQLFYTTPLRIFFEGEFVLGLTVNGESLAEGSLSVMVSQLRVAALRYALGICLLWTVGLSLLGWLIFSRREIK